VRTYRTHLNCRIRFINLNISNTKSSVLELLLEIFLSVLVQLSLLILKGVGVSRHVLVLGDELTIVVQQNGLIPS
jgi:hypothetical protein